MRETVSEETLLCTACPPHGGASVSELVDERGLGSYQLHVFVLLAGVFISEACIIQTIPGILIALNDEESWPDEAAHDLPTILLLVGVQCGALFSGPFGRIFGRRWPVLFGYVGFICIALVISQLPTLCVVLFLFLGFFAGFGIPVAIVGMAEVTPTSLRGVMVSAMGIMICVGQFWAAVGFWLFMPDMTHGPWRALLLWSLLPPAILLLVGLTSEVTQYDTPHFHALWQHSDELTGVMNLMAKMNKRTELVVVTLPKLMEEDDAVEVPHLRCASISEVTWIHIVIMCVILYCKEFTSAGTAAYWPVLLSGPCIIHDMSSAALLMVMTASGLPGVFIAMQMMYSIPRRTTLAVGATISGLAVSFLALTQVGENCAYGIGFTLLFKLSFPMWQFSAMLLPAEILPTTKRSVGTSLAQSISRFGMVSSAPILGSGDANFLITCITFAVLAGVLVWFLPETRTLELADCENDSKARQQTQQTVTPYGGVGHST